jgi:hypothetical protein
LAPPGASAEQSSLRFNGFSDAFGLLAPGLGLLLTRIKAVWLTTSPCCVLCMLPSNPCRASVALACVLAGCPIPVTGQTVKAVAIFFWLGMLRFLPGVSPPSVAGKGVFPRESGPPRVPPTGELSSHQKRPRSHQKRPFFR